MTTKHKNPTQAIESFTSAVFDRGRRGNPKPGCDCEQCFGYCLTDADKASRVAYSPGIGGVRRGTPLDFN